MPEKAVRNSFFEKICRIGSRKKAYADALAFFIVFAASVLTTFAVGRLVPSSEEARLSVTVEDAAGDAILEEKDIEDISIFYATEDNPEFSDQHKISKDDILSYCPAVLNWKYATHLPNSIVGIRVDIALAETAGLKDGVFPEVKLKINKTKFYGSARRKKHLILRKTEGNHYQFEIGKKGVAGSRTSYSWRVLFSLFFIIMTAFLALRSFCADVFSHRDKARREGKSLSAGSVQTICLKCLMIVSFFLLSLFPVFKFNPDKIDTWENRTLEPFPEHFHFNDASACNAWKALSLRYSEKVETPVAKITASAMPTDSYHSDLPMNAKNTLSANAKIKILMIGSSKLFLSLSQNPSRACSVMRLSP